MTVSGSWSYKFTNQPTLYIEGKTCASEAYTIGALPSAESCALEASRQHCQYFMLSQEHPDWACRCCDTLPSISGTEDSNENWAIYEANLGEIGAVAVAPGQTWDTDFTFDSNG